MSPLTSYYIIKADVLPEILKKTVQAKELLKKGEVATVNEAVKKVGMSRSAYYKYRDHVFPFYEASEGKIVTLSLILEDIPGVLSSVLNAIAKMQGNILTINQNIPIHDIANVTVQIRTANMKRDVEELIHQIEKIDGVKKIEILAQE